jgi:hypothetical protein
MGPMRPLAAPVSTALPKSMNAPVFGDPLMLQTRWTPLMKGGAAPKHGNRTVLLGMPVAWTDLTTWPARLRFDGTTWQYGIRAIQLVPEFANSGKRDSASDETRRVREGDEQINLAEDGNLETLRDDGARVAALLGCPPWDAEGR